MISKGKTKKVSGEVICSTAQSEILYKKHLWQLDLKVQWNNIKKHVFRFMRNFTGNIDR